MLQKGVAQRCFFLCQTVEEPWLCLILTDSWSDERSWQASELSCVRWVGVKITQRCSSLTCHIFRHMTIPSFLSAFREQTGTLLGISMTLTCKTNQTHIKAAQRKMHLHTGIFQSIVLLLDFPWLHCLCFAIRSVVPKFFILFPSDSNLWPWTTGLCAEMLQNFPLTFILIWLML